MGNKKSATRKQTTYILESAAEAARLEKQALMRPYRIEEFELSQLGVGADKRVLDAGCGSGAITRYLSDIFPEAKVEGCDFSALRLRDARRFSRGRRYEKIRFFEASLYQLPVEDHTYDATIARFVLQHLEDPLRVIKELHRVTKPGGKILVIDADGFFFNLFPTSPTLTKYLEQLKEGLKIDMFIGRKLPWLLTQAKYQSPQLKIEAFDFSNLDERTAERDMMRQRINQVHPILCKIFGSEKAAHEFRDLYCSEIMRPEAVYFHNKFIVTALA